MTWPSFTASRLVGPSEATRPTAAVVRRLAGDIQGSSGLDPGSTVPAARTTVSTGRPQVRRASRGRGAKRASR